MTRYEDLLHKASLCRQAAFRCEDEAMKKEWISKANALEIEAGNLPVRKANDYEC
ncbi:MAG: hypothetical protein MJ174_07565 [Treponema sp.]|nr:hypothetical protein [Treponema sp.]